MTRMFTDFFGAAAVDALAQDSDGIIPNRPEDGGALVVFVIVGVALGGVYWLIRRSRRRSENDYWERRAREEKLRRNDPDMARPSDTDQPGADSDSDEG
jgi:hypothetical protein